MAKPTARQTSPNGEQDPAALTALLPAPFLIGQRVMAEAARFWAHRLRSYATLAESLSACQAPGDMVAAQTRFLEQMQADYAEENGAMAEILSETAAAAQKDAKRAPGAEAG